MSSPTKLQIVAATLLSGAAFYRSTGLGEFWPLAWIAPLPVLVVAFRSSAKTAAAVAFAAYLLGSLNMFSYLSRIMPLPALLVSLLVPALAFALAVFITRRIVLRLPAWAGAFAFPAIWTCWEWLVSVVSPHGSAGSLAYSQLDALAIIQVASLAGFLGITFLLMLAPSAIAVAWHKRRRKQKQKQKQKLSALAGPFVILLASLLYGWARLAQPPSTQTIRVGLAATDTTVRYFATEKSQEALPVLEAYAARVAVLAARGANLIVLPEKFVGVTPEYRDAAMRILSAAARDHRVTLVAGLNLRKPGLRNIADVFSPQGDVLVEYDKARMLPGPETGYQPGHTPAFFSQSGSKCGVAICKDMDFPEWTRNYSQAGARLLVVPAWDFVVDGRAHSRMAVLRGVEGGFAIVRCAQEGRLTVSDHCGRIVAEESTSGAPQALLVADAHPGPGATLYTSAGNWIAWCSLLIVIVSLTLSLARPRPA